jgi:Trm5-related predicted tRNA methylase
MFENINAPKWPINFHEGGVSFADSTEEAKEGVCLKAEDTVYLSPDAEEALTDFDVLKTNFIIGGLIDRTIVKNASLNQSKNIGVVARRLPLAEFSPIKVTKTELSIN